VDTVTLTPEEVPMALAAILKTIKPAVVPLGTRIGNKPVIIGTGFNVDPSGIIVSCRHVVEGLLIDAIPDLVIPPGERVGRASVRSFPLFAMFHHIEGEEVVVEGVPPTFICGPTRRDVAIIALPPRDPVYPALEIGDSDVVSEGEAVAACGFPLGLALQENSMSGTCTFTGGIISAVLPHPEVPPGRRNSLQLDISINPGNSGGPVVLQESGRVVGIVRASLAAGAAPTGLSYAVPINVVRPFVDRVRHDREAVRQALERGELPEGWD
jgi:S1-C subfamily serine protease